MPRSPVTTSLQSPGQLVSEGAAIHARFNQLLRTINGVEDRKKEQELSKNPVSVATDL